MELVVNNKFENVFNAGKNNARAKGPAKHFHRCTLIQGRRGLGRVDGMMANSFNTIVAAYKRAVKKDGADMFKPGPAVIEIEVSDCYVDFETITIPVTLV